MRVRIWPAAVLLTAGVAAGCGPRAVRSERPRTLAGSLDVVVAADTVWLTLHATNVSGAPLQLRFSSAQRFEFEVRSQTGAEVWRWSAGQAFAQVTGEERVEAGATRQWRAWWPVAGRVGQYVAVGRLVALDQPLALSAAFEVVRE